MGVGTLSSGLQLYEIEQELEVRNWNQRMATGKNLTTACVDISALHPVVQQVLKRQAELQMWLENHSFDVAYRPEHSQVGS
jgi:hypothetical protein